MPLEDRWEQGDYVVEIWQEEDASYADPRDADNLGIMFCQHRRYQLGDMAPVYRKHTPEVDEVESVWEAMRSRGYGADRFVRWLRMFAGATCVLPLYLIDHSGIAMNTGGFSMCDPQGWDWGMVGVIFDSPRTRKDTGVEPEDVHDQLETEVKVYSAWLEGSVYGYVVKRQRKCDLGYVHEEVVDSVGGYIIVDPPEMEDLRSEAKHAVTYHKEME